MVTASPPCCHRPRPDPAAELRVRLDHDHRTPRSASPTAAAIPAMPPPATSTGPVDGARSARRAPPDAAPRVRTARGRQPGPPDRIMNGGHRRLAGAERVQDVVLPAGHRTHLHVDETRGVQPIDEGLRPSRRQHAAPQVAVEPGLPGGQPAQRNHHGPADQGPDRGGEPGAGDRILLDHEGAVVVEQVVDRRQHLVPLGDVAEQVRREHPRHRIAEPPGLPGEGQFLRHAHLEADPGGQDLARAWSSMPAEASTPTIRAVRRGRAPRPAGPGSRHRIRNQDQPAAHRGAGCPTAAAAARPGPRRPNAGGCGSPGLRPTIRS